MMTGTVMTVIVLIARATKRRKKDTGAEGVAEVVKEKREREIKREGKKLQ